MFGAPFGFGSGIGSGVDKVLLGTTISIWDTVSRGIESVIGMQNNSFNNLSVLLRQHSPDEIKQICDKNPNFSENDNHYSLNKNYTR